MHGRSGAAGRTCLDRTPIIGTRVLSSVSAFGVCSFAPGVQQPKRLRRPPKFSCTQRRISTRRVQGWGDESVM
eukprot:6199951-Prymnesium_polylepis.1